MDQAKSTVKAPLGERELIVLMALLMSLQAFGIDSILPALGAMASSPSVAGNDRQLVISAYFLGTGLGAIVPGAMADRFGRRPVLMVGLVFYFTLSLVCAVVSNFWWLVGLRMVQGFGAASLSVLPAAIIRDHVGGDKMARMMSLIMMIFLLVPLIAPAIGQVIYMLAGWRWIFGAMAVMSLFVGLWVYLRLPESLAEQDKQEIKMGPIFRNMREALLRRDSIGYVIGSALIFGALFGFLNSSEQLIGESFDQANNFALIFGASVAGMVVANFANSRIVERFGARWVSHMALFALLFFASLQYFSASQADQPLWQFLPIHAATIAMMGFIGVNFGSIAMQPFHHIAGSASSAQTFLRLVSASLLGGFIGNQFDGSARPFAIALLSCAILALAAVLFSERGRLFRRIYAPKG